MYFKKQEKRTEPMVSNDELSDEYYRTVEIVLNTTACCIAEVEKFERTVFSFSGRNGSTSFEDDFLKPFIRKHKHLILKKVEKALKEERLSHWELFDIVADENIDESGARSMEDVALVLRRPNGLLVEEAINVKATLGGTADNVGGWISLDRALFGNSPDGKYMKQRGTFLKKVANEPITDSLSDYFLWVFTKLDNPVGVLKSSRVYSFFGTSLDAFVINKNQPFPLQFRSKGAKTLIGSGIPLIERKIELMTKLHSEMYEKLSAELEMHDNALNNVLKQKTS